VYFSYRQGVPPILAGVSFHVPAGESVTHYTSHLGFIVAHQMERLEYLAPACLLHKRPEQHCTLVTDNTERYLTCTCRHQLCSGWAKWEWQEYDPQAALQIL
jgi:hypothetical protein